MMRMRSEGGRLSRAGLAVALLWLAGTAQAQSGPAEAARRAMRAAEEAAAAVAALESGQAGMPSQVEVASTPPALVARYAVAEGGFAGSTLQLSQDGGYVLQLAMAPVPRSSRGRWSLQDDMVLLQPQDSPRDTVQLVPYEALADERARLQQQFAQLQQALSGTSDEQARARLEELRAQFAPQHVAGTPLQVTLLDPVSGVASDGVQVVLELAQGEPIAADRLAGGNSYRFPAPLPGQAVTAVLLHFPGLAEPVRLPLPAPLRPGYLVLFDACAVGMCVSDTMGLMLEQQEGQVRLQSFGVGVFNAVDD